MDEREEFHLLGTDYLINYVGIVSVAHVHEVLVSCYERLLAQLSLQIYSQSFYSIAHRVRGLNSWQVLEEFWRNAHFWRLLSIWITFLRIVLAITVIVGHALVVAQTTPGLRLTSISIATYLSKLSVLTLSRARGTIGRLFIALTCLNNAATVCLVALRRARHDLALQIFVVVLLRFLVRIRCGLIILPLLEIITMLHSG